MPSCSLRAFSGFHLFAALITLISLLCTTPASARPIDAKSAILMDVTTGRILYEQRADMRIPPASLTKVLSMYVAMDAISARKADYHSKVKVSRNAARTRGSSMNLKTGDVVTLDKLFYGMAVASGNDASAAVAEYIAGSEGAFVQRMNSLARRLGMKKSHFKNVHGMPAEGQYTTARDMLLMARSYEAKYPRARKYHLAKSVTHNRKTEPNHNPLVGYYRGLNGLKTGWVTAAGYNIIVSARRDGHKLIGVILGAPNTSVRAAEARRLLNAGFKSLGPKKPTVYAELGVSDRLAKRFKSSSATAATPKKKVTKTSSKKSEAAMKKERARNKARMHAKAEQKKKIAKNNVHPQGKHVKTNNSLPPHTKTAGNAPKAPPASQSNLSPAEAALADLKAKQHP